jgi:hypothetical protein
MYLAVRQKVLDYFLVVNGVGTSNAGIWYGLQDSPYHPDLPLGTIQTSFLRSK